MITKILGDGNFTEPLTVHLVPPDYTNVNKGVCLCFLFNNQPPGFADIEQLTVPTHHSARLFMSSRYEPGVNCILHDRVLLMSGSAVMF